MLMDITSRRIPNACIVLILLNGVCFFVSSGDLSHIDGSIIAPLITFIVGLLLSYGNVIGMGDIKLLSVGILLVPEHWQVDAIYFAIFAGGIWGVLWHFLLSKIPIIKKYDKVQNGIPYGIPIALSILLFTFVK